MACNERIPVRTDQAAFPTILLVANNLKLLKLVEMALKVEFACEVLSTTTGRSAGEAARRVRLDLAVIDALLLDGNALELGSRLRSIEKLESLPTILVNAPVASRGESPKASTIFLSMPFVLVDFYAAVNQSLGRT